MFGNVEIHVRKNISRNTTISECLNGPISFFFKHFFIVILSNIRAFQKFSVWMWVLSKLLELKQWDVFSSWFFFLFWRSECSNVFLFIILGFGWFTFEESIGNMMKWCFTKPTEYFWYGTHLTISVINIL